jgi:predicted dehydrogenase/threonine dehydrogenase-like Zn-dependent dehydrogenase
MQVLEVPPPVLGRGMVLVRNIYSLISSGTEGSTVNSARRSLIGKAKERPQQVRQVLDVLVQQGPVQAYRAVMKKLDAWLPLGYSCVGEVIDMGSDVSGFQISDRVACGGLTASHAEVVAVPVNLCVKLPRQAGDEPDTEAYLKAAAYNTLGAIALQGVRQADPRLGETCGVIGLGLLGQLTCLLLKASGVRVVGVDINPVMVGMAASNCADAALVRDEAGIEEKILAFTEGIGCDAVMITAASESLDPINFGGAIARKRGTLVVVGAVPTGFDREPHFYRKELTVRMSCSYGPGRYDPEYEEKGRDYPVGYVRWTEKRNMEAFQTLIAFGKIDLSFLTTHVFKLEDASKAYDLILNKTEPYLGILIEYDRTKEVQNQIVKNLKSRSEVRSPKSEIVKIAFIGAGSYAQSHLLPNVKSLTDVVLQGVMTSTPASARSVVERFGFAFCTGREQDILENGDINTVFIATRHDSHARYVLGGLRAGKHVFVEKPLCLNEQELDEIRGSYYGLQNTEAARKGENSHKTNPQSEIRNPQSLLMVGFNRRFSPLTALLKGKLGGGPMAMIYRVNAGRIPKDSWIQDRERGGGRIVGEVCHFVDYLTFLNGSLPCGVFASVLPDPAGCEDTVTINLQFQNGSIGSIAYFANGSKGLFKEYVEVHQAGVTAVLKDFRELSIYGDGRSFRKKLFSQDKGQKYMVRAFVEAVRAGQAAPIPFEEIDAVTLTTFKILESFRKNERVEIPAPMSAR